MKILAVSGGLDSMVLLDKFQNEDILIAHFNHQSRASADLDEEFVKSFAKHYRKPFVSAKLSDYLAVSSKTHLSESVARTARYQFLYSLLKSPQDKIYTAHHFDDLLETIFINFLRGTNWRGLTPFYDQNIIRPFLLTPKTELLRYSATHQIKFRQDPTNTENLYFRNRLRDFLKHNLQDEQKNQIKTLFLSQNKIRQALETVLADFYSSLNSITLKKETLYPKNIFTNTPIDLEILKFITAKHQIFLTYPKLTDFLTSIKNYQPSTLYNLPKNQFSKITKQHFSLPTPDNLL